MAEGAVFDAQAVTDAVAEGIAKIENASTMEELKAIKTQYAGAESAMTQASKAIGALPKDQKKDAGKLMGKLRADFGRAFGTKEKQVKAEEEARELAAETVDMTLPVNRKPLGARHPLPKLMEDVEDFFISMGTDEYFDWCAERGLAVYAADVYGTDARPPEPLTDVLAVPQSLAQAKTVLFGNEARGLTQDVLERVDRIVSIPIYGKAESLNLGTSAAVMLLSLAMSSHVERM